MEIMCDDNTVYHSKILLCISNTHGTDSLGPLTDNRRFKNLIKNTSDAECFILDDPLNISEISNTLDKMRNVTGN